MSWRTQGRNASATNLSGITVERGRVDLNAFVIVCYCWHTRRVPPVSVFPASTESVKRDMPQARAA